MLEQIGSIYRDSWRAAWLFPVLFLIPALALESLVTSAIACLGAGSAYLAARHAAQRKGISLTAEPG